MGDRVGRAVIGDRLEDQLTLDFEHVADLVENPRQLTVRQQRGVIHRAFGGFHWLGRHGPMVA